MGTAKVRGRVGRGTANVRGRVRVRGKVRVRARARARIRVLQRSCRSASAAQAAPLMIPPV